MLEEIVLKLDVLLERTKKPFIPIYSEEEAEEWIAQNVDRRHNLSLQK